MSTRLTEPRAERFRIVDAQFIHGPKWFKLDNFEISGYLQGERIDMISNLTLDHFDEITYIGKSFNSKNDKEFYHVIGFRADTQKNTVIVLRKKEIEYQDFPTKFIYKNI
jgi:hypothetical protein